MNTSVVNIRDMHGLTPLHVACIHGHLSVVRLVLRSGANVNIQDNNNMTPLLQAILHRQLPSAKLLMAKSDLSVKCNLEFGNGLAPLHLATVLRESDLVQELLDHDSDPLQLADNVPVNAWMYTRERLGPMHIASLNGDVDVFELLSRRAIIKDAVTNRVSPLSLAVANNQYQMVRYLVATGSDVNHRVTVDEKAGYTALHVAADEGRTDIVEFLLLHGADPNIRTLTASGMPDKSALVLAYQRGHFDTMNVLLSRTKLELWEHRESNPLVEAAVRGQTDLWQELLNAKVQYLRDRGKLRITEPVVFDICSDHERPYEASDSLSTPDDITRNDAGNVVIRLAASHRYVHVMTMLFKCLDPDQPIDELLHLAVADHLAFPVLSLLVVHGVDTTCRNEFGYSALHTATEHNNIAAAQALLLVNSACEWPIRKGDLHLSFMSHINDCDPLVVNLTNRRGQTSLHLAARGGHIPLIEGLLLAGGDVNMADEEKVTPLHLACSMGRLPTVTHLLLAGADIEARCQWGFNKRSKLTDVTALHLALIEKEKAVVELLLANGADVNSRFESRLHMSTTGLHMSICNREWDDVRLLLWAGSSTNIAGRDRSTPLVEALKRQSPLDITKELLKCGADPNAVSGDDITAPLTFPLETLVNTQFVSGRLNLLLNYGADINRKAADGKTVLHKIVQHLSTGNRDTRNLETLLKLSRDMERHIRAADIQGLSEQLRCSVCDFTSADCDGNTILYTALNGDNDACAKLILKYWENQVVTNGSGDSLLRVAVQKRSPTIVRRLIELGCDIHDTKAWAEVLKSADEEMIRIFSEFAQGVDIILPLNSELTVYGNLLHYALLRSSEICFSTILSLKLAHINAMDSLGRTPFYLAVAEKRHSAALTLLAAGASVRKALEYREPTGRDLLHTVVCNSQKMFLSLLVLHTPDIDRTAARFEEEQDVTALHMAAIIGRPDVVDILLRAGSDVTRLTASGKDASLLATERGHEVIRQDLDSHPKRENNASKALNLPLSVAERELILCPRFEDVNNDIGKYTFR
ncbi:putative ankyrin repeat protein RF_0381 [Liolophura sinensis]|uniref:putative ankyrin repeat protein RF_0381 n=1 Tax=Liolophura sinensis TaxID=3198878 RepID=UPI0031597CF1